MSGSVGFIGHDSAAQVAVVQGPLIVEARAYCGDQFRIPDGPVDAGALGQARLRQIRSTQGVDDKTSHVARDHRTAVAGLLAAPRRAYLSWLHDHVHPIYHSAQRQREYRRQP
jgi:hypothetical protein